MTARKTPISKVSGVPMSMTLEPTETLPHIAVMNVRPKSTGAVPLESATSKPMPSSVAGSIMQGAAPGGHAVGHDIQDEGRGNDETADESPAGFVVPAQEQKQREQHQQRHQEARRCPEDQRAHR